MSLILYVIKVSKRVKRQEQLIIRKLIIDHNKG